MRTAILPAKEIVSARELRAATGISDQLRYHYRKRHGFPNFSGNGTYVTREVIAWLRSNGWNVEVR